VKKSLVIVFIVLFLVLFGYVFFLNYYKRGQEQNKIPVSRFSPLKKTGSSAKILSVSKNYKISVYDPQTQALTLLPIQVETSIRTQDGTTGAISSPDNKWVAYIDKITNEVWIIDSDGNNKTQISKQHLTETTNTYGTTLLISGISSDDHFLVFKVIVGNELGGDTSNKLKPSILRGFYLADLSQGKVYFLANLPSYLDFIPNTHKVVFESDYRRKRLYSYNVETGAVEKITTGDPLRSLTLQYSFSADNHVAYTTGSINRSTSQIYYATLDNLQEQIIDQGGWADLQWPLISPDNKRLAYEKLTPLGLKKVILYDLISGQKTDLGVSKDIIYWFDNQNLVAMGGPYGGPWTLELIRLNHSSTTIAHDQALR